MQTYKKNPFQGWPNLSCVKNTSYSRTSWIKHRSQPKPHSSHKDFSILNPWHIASTQSLWRTSSLYPLITSTSIVQGITKALLGQTRILVLGENATIEYIGSSDLRSSRYAL